MSFMYHWQKILRFVANDINNFLCTIKNAKHLEDNLADRYYASSICMHLIYRDDLVVQFILEDETEDHIRLGNSKTCVPLIT